MRRLIAAWVVLVALLAGNIGLAFLGAGAICTAGHVVIAAAMALIVLIVFMELDRGLSLLWVAAGAGFFWLALLFILSAADYLTRYSFAPS
jgi:cytochrome c oxidase subunit 4